VTAFSSPVSSGPWAEDGPLAARAGAEQTRQQTQWSPHIEISDGGDYGGASGRGEGERRRPDNRLTRTLVDQTCPALDFTRVGGPTG